MSDDADSIPPMTDDTTTPTTEDPLEDGTTVPEPVELEPVAMTAEEEACRGLYVKMVGTFLSLYEQREQEYVVFSEAVVQWWMDVASAVEGLEVPAWVSDSNFGI